MWKQLIDIGNKLFTLMKRAEKPKDNSTNVFGETTGCPDAIAPLVAGILREGILAARVAAWGNDAARSAMESDHIHNLPLVFLAYDPHHLHYYWNTERPSYIKESRGRSLAQFTPYWKQLKPLIAALPKSR